LGVVLLVVLTATQAREHNKSEAFHAAPFDGAAWTVNAPIPSRNEQFLQPGDRPRTHLRGLADGLFGAFAAFDARRFGCDLLDRVRFRNHIEVGRRDIHKIDI
jgi:hypothetical protein